MGLRVKIFIIMATWLAALVVALSLLGSHMVSSGFETVERDLMRTSVQRAQDAIAHRAATLNDKLEDWASWDDTYAFIESRSRSYIDSNLGPESLETLGVEAVALMDVDGNLVLCATAGGITTDVGALPRSIAEIVGTSNGLVRHPDERSSTYGLLASDDSEELLVVASRPILTSARQGPIRGSIMFVQALTEGDLQRKADEQRLRIAIIDPRSWNNRDAARFAELSGGPGDATLCHIEGPEVLVGYGVLRDYTGRPVRLLRTEASRPIHARAVDTVNELVLMLLAISCGMLVALMVTVNRLVTSRLASLDRQITSIATDPSGSLRVSLKGRDELARLGASVNSLLDQVAASQSRLHASERRFQQVTAYAPIMIWMTDESLSDIYHSGALLEFVGTQTTALEQLGWTRLIHPDDRDRVRADFERWTSRRECFVHEFRLRRADGEYRIIRANGRPWHDEQGRFAGYAGSLEDVTDSRQAQQLIAESEAKFRTMFECSPVAMALAEVDGQLVQANAVFMEMIGATPGDVPSLSLADVMDPATSAALLMEEATLRFGPRECALLALDGRRVPVLLSAAGVSSAGNSARMWLFAESLAERIEAEERLHRFAADLVDAKGWLEQQTSQLEQRTRELEVARAAADEANRAKSDFLANMSHEIRTPMTAILGYADLLAEPEVSDAQRAECIVTIRRSGEHLLSIINDILDFSKIEAGSMGMESISCDPASIVREVGGLFDIRARQKGLTLGIEVASPFPATCTTDPIRLRQIIVNLVSNAIKFTERGQVSIKLRATRRDDGGATLAFDVADSGIGMTAEQVARLFRPFTQADTSTTRRFGGTGLGLTISKRLAGLLGGDLVVSSTPQVGTTFTLTLDAGPANTLRWDAPSQSGRSSPATPATRLAARVLLAEDGPDNRRLLEFHLRRAGAEMVMVDNGRKALDAALDAWRAGTPYDLVLMDMQMPEMDGYEATRALREAGYPGPVLALTAHAMSTDRDKCLEAGCDDYITKPIDKALLIDRCAEWMSRAHVRRGDTSARTAPNVA